MAFVDVLGTNIFYESIGDGEPIVLVHGGFLDHSLWMLSEPILAERFRVVTLDLPGHGRSGGSFDPTLTPPEVMTLVVDHIVLLVEQLGLAPAHFAGQSFGGGALLQSRGRPPRPRSQHEPARARHRRAPR